MSQGAINRKDDLAPVILGRVKKDSLRAIVEGLEQEAVDRFVVKLLHHKSLNAAAAFYPNTWPDNVTADRKREAVKTMLKEAITAAEGLQ